MIQQAETQLAIAERVNKPKDGFSSLFMMDALNQLISLQCQTKTMNDEVLKNVARLELICG